MLKAMQPLFLMAVFATWIKFPSVNMRPIELLWVLLVILMTILHESKGRDAWGKCKWYRIALVSLWILSFIVIELLAMQTSGKGIAT